MLRRHSQRCADADILVYVCVRRNTVRVRSCLTTASADVRRRSVSSLTSSKSAMYSVLSDCHKLKNFSVKVMNNVTSYADY